MGLLSQSKWLCNKKLSKLINLINDYTKSYQENKKILEKIGN